MHRPGTHLWAAIRPQHAVGCGGGDATPRQLPHSVDTMHGEPEHGYFLAVSRASALTIDTSRSRRFGARVGRANAPSHHWRPTWPDSNGGCAPSGGGGELPYRALDTPRGTCR